MNEAIQTMIETGAQWASAVSRALVPSIALIAIFIAVHGHLWRPCRRNVERWEWEQLQLDQLVSADEQVGPRGPSAMQTLAQRLAVYEERTNTLCTYIRSQLSLAAVHRAHLAGSVSNLRALMDELQSTLPDEPIAAVPRTRSR